MINYTHKSHFVYGFGASYAARQSDDDSWFVNYGRCTRQSQSFIEECINTAKLIRDETSGPLWVMLSGGADSECVLQSFVLARIPVRALIVRFKHDLNIHDISYGVIAAEILGVPYKIIDLDIHKFWETEALEICSKINCSWLAMALVCWSMDQVDGVPLVGNGEFYFRLQKDNLYYNCEREATASLYYYLQYKDRMGVPGFYQYTPEIMHSWLQIPSVKDLIEKKATKNSEKLKIAIYEDQFKILPRIKYTGYEKVLTKKRNIEKALPFKNETAWIDYHTLQTMLELK